MPWYYYRGGIRKGPIEDPTFRQMAAQGQLEPTDLVWSPGMKEWAQAATIPGLLQPPPIPVLSQVESEPFVFGISSALPAPAATSTPTATPMVPHTQSKSDQPEPSKPSPTRETGSPQQVRERQPRAAIPPSKGGKCPKCAFLLSETAPLMRDYRCPACGSRLDSDAGQSSRVPTNKPGPSTLAERVPNSGSEETEVQTPGGAYPLAILSGFVGVMCGLLVTLSVPAKSTLVVPATFLGSAVSLGLVGWLFGRKWPALGWRWAFWIAGPVAVLSTLTGKTKIATAPAAMGIGEAIGYVLAMFLYLFIPAAFGARLGSRQARSKH